MKILLAITLLAAPIFAGAQSLPKGTTYGAKPTQAAMVQAKNLWEYMGTRTRISTVISGKVINVVKSAGGWFNLDAGDGKKIAAHFKNYKVKIPASLNGRNVIVDGVVQKQFMADDMQHFAGDTVIGKKQHTLKTGTKQQLTIEVSGLTVQ